MAQSPSTPSAGSHPTLAVVITCFNYERYVERAIHSVISQDPGDWELLVVDDGSTDLSWDKICRCGVKAYRTENRGQRAACVFALDRTRAPFILFLDADDELKPGALAAVLAKLDTGVAKLQFSLTGIDAGGVQVGSAVPFLKIFPTRDALTRRILQTGVYPSPPTSGNVFRRDVCELLRQATYDKAVDGVILFAAPFMGDVVTLPDEYGCYRVHDRNDSGMGRQLDSAILQRDLRRFVERMDHLRRIIGKDAEDLVSPRQTFFYLERSFYLDIVNGRRPSAAHLFRLLSRLWHDYHPLPTKVMMTVFFAAATVLPVHRVQPLLAYRFKVGPRSLAGLFRLMLEGDGKFSRHLSS